MLSKQFFTRVQVTKLLGFKSDNVIKYLEKKGFISPEIKPSKYSLNQVLFLYICKEMSDFTNLSWTDFMDAKLNNFLEENLLDFDLLIILQYTNTNQPYGSLQKNKELSKELDRYFDSALLDAVSKLTGRENTTYENIPSIYINKDIMFVSINRVYRKLKNKCTELKINLEEKITA